VAFFPRKNKGKVMCIKTPEGAMVLVSAIDRTKVVFVGPTKTFGEEQKDFAKRQQKAMSTAPFASTRCSCNTMDEPKGQIFDPATNTFFVGEK
jgi:hypothetical protein